MKVIVAHTPKGGSGKTTLARELAVSATLAGLTVAMADLDPQRSLTGWYGRRDAPEPVLVSAPGGKPDLAAIEAGGVDLLVIDTAPGTPAGLAPLLARADAVLVPVRPSPDDLLSAAPIAASLAKAKAWAFVLSQSVPRSRLAQGAVRQLAALGRVAPVTLHARLDYPTAAITGQAAAEFSGTKAAEEITHLLTYARTLAGLTDAKA